MPSSSQQNLETVVVDFFGALGRGDFDAASSLLDRDVTWQGLRDDLVCRGREEVIETFRWALDERRETDALEFIRGGDRVVMGARGPSLTEVGGEPLDGQIYNVFTLRDGRITRIDDYRRRSEALAAADIAADPGWH
jgi:ketosteroid isomerase-like protein